MKRTTTFAAMVALAATAAGAQGNPGAHFIENWDLDGDEIVTVQELEIRRDDVFYTFDSNEDGRLDVEEYVDFDEARANDMADNAGHGNGMRRAAEGMTRAFNDADGDGAVDRTEFLARTAAWMALIDRDGSGTITQADFGQR